MNGQELRLGNFISHNHLGETVSRVTQISHLGICCADIDKATKWDLGNGDFFPIPLTDEWLIRFGFEPLENSLFNIHHRGAFRLYRYDGWNFVYRQADDTNNKNVPIEYVHQLQNLYFTLTGTELTLNLQP